MMDALTLTALLCATTINAALPGPCTILTASRAAADGWGAGMRITLGVVLANLVLAAVSLAAVLGALTISEGALGTIKWAGVAILLMLGLRMLLAQRAGNSSGRTGSLSTVGAGLATGLSSPYNLVFLLALLPQFLPSQMETGAVVAAVLAVLCGATVAQIGAVAVGVGSRGMLGAKAAWVERAGALCLLGFAASAMATPIT